MKRSVSRYEDLRADENSLPVMSGRAWVFGDGISRADILGTAGTTHPSAAPHASILKSRDPRFASSVLPGDVLVAGLDFAGDVTDERIASLVRALGIGAVLARSFGSFFEREALRAGLPALVVEETAAIQAGDRLRVDVEAHVVANLSSGDRYVIQNVDDESLAILRTGGVPSSPTAREPR